MTSLWFRGQPYVIPESWDVFVIEGWTLTRNAKGFAVSRIGFRTIQVAA